MSVLYLVFGICITFCWAKIIFVSVQCHVCRVISFEIISAINEQYGQREKKNSMGRIWKIWLRPTLSEFIFQFSLMYRMENVSLAVLLFYQLFNIFPYLGTAIRRHLNVLSEILTFQYKYFNIICLHILIFLVDFSYGTGLIECIYHLCSEYTHTASLSWEGCFTAVKETYRENVLWI
jgi:hypothetical protein